MNIPISMSPERERPVRVHHVDRAGLTRSETRCLRSFHSSAIAELALREAPKSTNDRLHFIRRIERIACRIFPDQMYSVASMCRILDRSFTPTSDEPIKTDGATVINDLNRLAEFVTLAAPIPRNAAGDGVRDIVQLASDFHVSRKSILRWRSRGLVGFRVAGSGAVGRLAFSTFTVDKLSQRFPKLTNRKRQQTRVDDRERECIINLARELVLREPMTRYQVAQRLASQVGRAIETVHSVLRDYVAKHPEDPIARDPETASPRLHALTGDASATAAGSRPANAERALLEIEVLRIQHGHVQFVDNELFRQADADAIILSQEPAAPPIAAMEASVVCDDPCGPLGSPAPLMSPEEERDAFCRYNYLKYKAIERARPLRTDTATSAELEEVVELMRNACKVRDRIVQANLRLVVHVAKPFVRRTIRFLELISEGNVTLLRAVECFDIGRGFKFSTYLTHSLRRAYSKAVAKEMAHAARFHTNLCEESLEREDCHDDALKAELRDSVRRVLADGLRRLSSRERFIVRHRFGFTKTSKVWTLGDIAARLGVSKERVRQLQVKAIEKLGEHIDPGVMQMLRAAA